jgi:pilus assembly protein CpaF
MPVTVARTPIVDQGRLELRRSLQDKLIASFDLRRIDIHKMDDVQLRKQAENALREILKSVDLSPTEDKDALIAEVRDEAIGLGLLEPLLADPDVTEIMVNAYDEIFVERTGMLSRMPLAFSSEKSVMGIIERIVAPVGRRIDESSPLVDARLKDGSRFNAIIPPLALKGPSMTIRKFATKKLTGEDLIRFGSASENMVRFMQIAVQYKKNLIVSGGTGSGKTTLLNILSNFIPDNERIVTIEDAAELRLHHEHLVTLEGRPANAEGKGAVTIRDLVRNSLRMRPDRIVVGECRGGEALDMLQAMNTGHDGSLTTAHANTPRDMLARLEVMVLMSGMDLPVAAIREQVASAVDIVVQQTRYACGSRKISKICEVTGVESGKIQLQDLFEFVETGFGADHKVQGYFTACGAVPEFYEKLQAAGMNLDLDIFQKEH